MPMELAAAMPCRYYDGAASRNYCRRYSATLTSAGMAEARHTPAFLAAIAFTSAASEHKCIKEISASAPPIPNQHFVP